MTHPTTIRVDTVSLLVDAPAEATVAAIEAALAPLQLTLGIERGAWETVADLTLASWLEDGAVGAGDGWLDPADHLVAGLEAELLDGRTLVVRPAPRRATGPDLVAIVLGARRRFATLRRAWVRVHRVDARRPGTAPFESDRDPPVSAAEEELLAAIARELA